MTTTLRYSATVVAHVKEGGAVMTTTLRYSATVVTHVADYCYYRDRGPYRVRCTEYPYYADAFGAALGWAVRFERYAEIHTKDDVVLASFTGHPVQEETTWQEETT